MVFNYFSFYDKILLMKQEDIRNFCIIAHIDHGKSTLADRILDVCHAVTEREKKAQILDSMDLERERGITIKLNAVELKYKQIFNVDSQNIYLDYEKTEFEYSLVIY